MEKSVYKALVNFDFSQKAALCSMLQWKGSVPRKDYPQMLVLEDGKAIGTIGGGNIEHAVIEIAKTVIQTKAVIFKGFDLSHTKATAKGSICGGHTRFLIEPFSAEIQSFWKSIPFLEDHQKDIIIVTEVQENDFPTVKRYLIPQYPSQSSLPKNVIDTIKTVRKKRKSKSLELNQKFYLVQLIFHPPILHIFGAGHIAKAVAELAQFIDLDIYIYDNRHELANQDYFPHAKRIYADSFSTLVKKNTVAPQDFVLVATQGHQFDLEIMRWLLTLKTAYVGLMSSRTKWRILSRALKKEGFTSAQLNHVQAPVGLDIESETVPEIAVSIISEIIHFYRTGKRSVKSLSNKS